MNDGTTQQWVIRANGAEVGQLGSAQSVEIGRKPLRPLADDGMSRIDVPDETRSMSKRHAVFSVSENGAASVRDLASTNGTYVVRDNGELMRLPQNVDFLLPTSPMRMQFGDVPVDFVRVEQPEAQAPQPEVPDLFDYAVGDVSQEPDAADMSVDDILDLRAGEPTSMFNAGSVRQRAQELDDAQHQTFQPFPFEGDGVPLTIMPQSAQEETPRDLFEDAQSADVASEEQSQEPSVEQQKVDSVWTLVADQQGVHDDAGSVAAERLASEGVDAIELQTVAEDQTMVEMQPAIAEESVSDGERQSDAAEEMAVEPQTDDEQPQPIDEPAAGTPLVFTAMTADNSTPVVESSEPSESAESAEAFTPAFEPGSVFERVSQGGFTPPEPTVEVDGLTSDEAKRTNDFTLQFEMARHPQLLPFLAMNPSLYDDLYAWLAAQGNRDIDEALSRNEGYQEYRKAVGK